VSTHRYKAWNAPMVTTAPTSFVATGTSTKTMLQLATPSTRQITVISWGYTVDAMPGTTNTGKIDLIEADTGATITQHVAAGLQPLLPGVPASQLLISTTGQTGYTSSSETAPTVTRTLDQDIMLGANTLGPSMAMYEYQFMPDERPVVAVSKFLRLRATFGAGVNIACWIVWEE
jgi:hypothetical protein